jgi:hypothetical protein
MHEVVIDWIFDACATVRLGFLLNKPDDDVPVRLALFFIRSFTWHNITTNHNLNCPKP